MIQNLAGGEIFNFIKDAIEVFVIKKVVLVIILQLEGSSFEKHKCCS